MKLPTLDEVEKRIAELQDELRAMKAIRKVLVSMRGRTEDESEQHK